MDKFYVMLSLKNSGNFFLTKESRLLRFGFFERQEGFEKYCALCFEKVLYSIRTYSK